MSVRIILTRGLGNRRGQQGRRHAGLPLFLKRTRVAASVSTSTPRSVDTVENTPIQEEPTKKTKSSTSITAAYLDLAKARLSALVVTTTAAGFAAAGGTFQPEVLAACVVGTSLCSSSAAAWNQILEQDRDVLMKRTQQRPLVQGKLSLQQATTAASIWGVAGTGLLYAGTDPVTTALGVGNILLYAGLYTYMKPRTVYNTWVGAVVGAVPPVMGYTAATGGVLFDLHPALLAATLYLWQMPHFFALSYMYRADYQRGGFQMIPVTEANGERTAQIMVRYAWYLSAIPFIATAAEITTPIFAAEGILLNAYALSAVHTFQKDRTNANARHVFMTSLWYLPCVLMLFLLHSKVVLKDDENEEKDTANLVKTTSSSWMDQVRAWGHRICIHDVAAMTNMPEACPVVVNKQRATLPVAATVETDTVLKVQNAET